MEDYKSLKGFTDIGKPLISELLESNMISYLDWGLIDKGAFFNVTIPTSGQYGGNKHTLRLVDDPNFSDGQVWESFRGNWVWESGLSVGTPITISGVYVNNSFKALNSSGTYAHHIDYPLGRIVFDSPISTTATVNCEYSYKWVNILSADNFEWFKEIQGNSLRLDNPHFRLSASGDWDELGQNRIQLPAIAVELVSNGHAAPYALGGGHYVYRDCIFHIFTEDKASGLRLSDIVANQVDKTIFLYDLDAIAIDNRFPLDVNGSIASGALTYPQMIDAYSLYKTTFLNNESQKINKLGTNLWHIPVRCTLETILGNI